VTNNSRPPRTRRARLWAAAEARGVPLRTILTVALVVIAVYMLAKVVYRLRDVLLLILVAAFIAVILNPLVVALQRWKIRRRGWAVAVVTLWGLIVFVGLAFAFGYPLANGITHLAQKLPTYVDAARHGRGWIGHLVTRYHVQSWVNKNAPKLVTFGEGLAKPALSLGKGALTLLLQLFTIFILVLLLLLEGPKMRVSGTGLTGGLVGEECEFRFKHEAVVQENAHAPRPAEISLRDICSTDGQHGENRGIAPAFHQQGGNPFRMNFVGISHEVRRRRGG